MARVLARVTREKVGSDHVPEKWIIQWENFLDGGTNVARRIDTRLVEPLSRLTDVAGHQISGVKGRLAVRNLLRGYLLRLPVGQRVAEAIGYSAMSGEKIEEIAGDGAQTPGYTVMTEGSLEDFPKQMLY